MSQIFLFLTSMPFPGCCNTRWRDGQQAKRPQSHSQCDTLSLCVSFQFTPDPVCDWLSSWHGVLDLIHSETWIPFTWALISSMSLIKLHARIWLIKRLPALIKVVSLGINVDNLVDHFDIFIDFLRFINYQHLTIIWPVRGRISKSCWTAYMHLFRAIQIKLFISAALSDTFVKLFISKTQIIVTSELNTSGREGTTLNSPLRWSKCEPGGHFHSPGPQRTVCQSDLSLLAPQTTAPAPHSDRE